ncbi:MAG: M23 family metallopeptidase [Anaerolineae bacterium]|nr:M23 family metallopeptidase [Anaerolineae bacterium]
MKPYVMLTWASLLTAGLCLFLFSWGTAAAANIEDMSMPPLSADRLPGTNPGPGKKPIEPDQPVIPTPETPPDTPRGYTDLLNPATGQWIKGTDADPLAFFSRRPLDHNFIPEAGMFMDPLREEPHYGIDYTYPEEYLEGNPVWVHPIAPGYVTARSSCVACYVEGNYLGQVNWRYPRYNSGFGGIVVIETPYNADISIYTMYGHMARDSVSLGDFVTPEDIIGVAGTSGYSQEIHLHLEIRYGVPGKFWNADFGTQEVMDRWLGTMVVNPALAVFPEYHSSFAAQLNEWAGYKPRPDEIP